MSVLLRKLGARRFDCTTRSLRLSTAGREALVFAERILQDLGNLHAGMPLDAFVALARSVWTACAGDTLQPDPQWACRQAAIAVQAPCSDR